MAIIYEFFKWQEWENSDDVLAFLWVTILLLAGSMSIFFITKILLWERNIDLPNAEILDFQHINNTESPELINLQLWSIGNLIFGLLVIGFGIYLAIDSRGNLWNKLLPTAIVCLYGLFVLTIQLIFRKYQKKIEERSSGEVLNGASE